MGRPRKHPAPAPPPPEPEDESQEDLDEEPEAGDDEDDGPEPATSGGRPAISKADAVREALGQGKDGPEEGTDYIRSQYGIEMSRQMFSSYKAQEKARQAKKQGGAKAEPATETEPRRRAPAAPVSAPAPQATGLIGDIQAVRQLIAKHGAEGLKALVDALA